jgi:NDP-sugar pyrophosphorylase family protein
VLPVVILAGGLGTRLRDVTGDVMPKALVPVAGRPFLDHKLADLAHAGVQDVLVLVGRHGSAIEEHVAKSENFGLRVRCRSDGDRLLGTGGAVLAALPALPDAFWVTYGDTLLSFDVRDAESAFTSGGRLGLMTVLRNRDRWETSNVDVRDGRVTRYDKGCAPGTHEYLDYGMIALHANAFAGFDGSEPFDLGEVFAGLVERGELTTYEVADRFYDVGTVERLRETESVVAAGRHVVGMVTPE